MYCARILRKNLPGYCIVLQGLAKISTRYLQGLYFFSIRVFNIVDKSFKIFALSLQKHQNKLSRSKHLVKNMGVQIMISRSADHVLSRRATLTLTEDVVLHSRLRIANQDPPALIRKRQKELLGTKFSFCQNWYQTVGDILPENFTYATTLNANTYLATHILTNSFCNACFKR